MAVDWVIDDTGALQLTFVGLLDEGSYAEVQTQLSDFIREKGNFRILVLLDGFEGWAPGDWSNEESDRLAFENEGSIQRVAVVGDLRWKDEILMFAGHPFTAKDVRYFGPEDLAAAKMWIGEDD
jgi:hypothetical protein